jgi:hypothetical protein
VSGGTVYAGGTFTNIGLQPRNRIAALDIGSGLATAWDQNADNSVLDLEESGGTVYASGGFTSIGGAPRNHIAALDGAGLATSWDPNAATGFGVWDLAVDGGTVYAAGHFTNIGGQPRNRIAALDAGTGFATGWNPNASGPVSALAVSGGTVYAGGDFTSIGGDARGYLAELNTGTGLATAWNPNANYVVNALAVSGPRIYAGGNFTRVDGFPQSFITCLIRQELVDAPHSEAIGELAFEISPNPSRGVTLFHYALAQESHVRIRVYDVLGRLLAQLVDELRPAGRHQTSWGGTPSSRSLAAGLYLIQFESGERRITRRLVLLQ